MTWLCKTTIALIAAPSLGVAAFIPNTASAQRGMHGGGGFHSAMAGGFRGGISGHAFAPRFAFHNRVAVNNRFAFP